MATEKLQLFRTVRKNFLSIALEENEPKFHIKQMFHTMQGLIAIIPQFLYILLEAESIKQYMYSILLTVVGILIYISYLESVLNTRKMFAFMNDIQNMVNESEFNSNFKLVYLPK